MPPPSLRPPHLAAALALGIWLGEQGAWPGAVMWWLVALALALVGWSSRRWLGVALSCGCALGAGGGSGTARDPTGASAFREASSPDRASPLPAARRWPAGVDDREGDRVVGVVVGPTKRVEGGQLFTVDLDGGVRLAVRASGDQILPGDRVRIDGRLRQVRGYRNPGGVDRAARWRGAELEIQATELEVVASSASPWRLAALLQRGATRAVAARGGDAAGNAIVRGAVLGDRSAIPREVDGAWRAAGTYHVLSVSGLHLAVVALLSFAVLRRVLAVAWGGSMVGLRLAAAGAGGFAVAYTAVTGAEVATVRALAVALIVLAGYAVSRRAVLSDALGVAALAILVPSPAALGDPGFQLSFAATAVLAAARPPSPPPPNPIRWRRLVASMARWVRRAVVTSAAVTAVTAPITAYHFHQVSLGGVIGNLVITPLLELVAIPAALLGLLFAPMAAPAAWLIDLAIAIAAVADGIARAIASLIEIVPVWPPRLHELALAALLVAVVVRGRCLGRARGWLAGGIVAVLAVLVARSLLPPPHLVVTFLDVGQGDAAVIETPSGEVWLVDAGGVAGAAPGGGPGEAVARFLAYRRIRHLDVAIVSHPHPDHYLGLVEVGERVAIDELWVAANPGGKPSEDPALAAILARLAAGGTKVVSPELGVARRAGVAQAAVRLRVHGPRYDPGDGAARVATVDPVRSVNDNSLVVSVEHAGRTVLFLGDVELEGEELLIASGAPVDVDVVKVAHHGSRTSSLPALTRATSPTIAVISAGVANRFGLPNREAMATWRDAGARVLRTDHHGAITIEIRAAGVGVELFDP